MLATLVKTLYKETFARRDVTVQSSGRVKSSSKQQGPDLTQILRKERQASLENNIFEPSRLSVALKNKVGPILCLEETCYYTNL